MDGFLLKLAGKNLYEISKSRIWRSFYQCTLMQTWKGHDSTRRCGYWNRAVAYA